MKISVLTENQAGGKLLAEHGLSYLLEIDGEQILFDTGHSDVFLKNAKQLGINIEKDVQKVVLSHGHLDHGDGLKYLENLTLITHPKSFIKRYQKSELHSIGLSLSKKEIEAKFNLIETTNAFQLTSNLWFLGEIPRNFDFESQTTTFKDETGLDDFVPDDSALAAVINNQLVVVTGCSHSGICNICEQAKKVTGISKISAVIGGFHLKTRNHQTQKTIEYLKENEVQQVFPSHCTDLPALTSFYTEFKFETVKTGMVFEFN